jgi:hypothetical protein
MKFESSPLTNYKKYKDMETTNFTVVINQTSVKTNKEQVTTTTKFNKQFEIAIQNDSSMGFALSRINKRFFYWLVEGKRSGMLKGLNLNSPFYVEVYTNNELFFSSMNSEMWSENGKCGVTENNQKRFASALAEQLKDNFSKKLQYIHGEDYYTSLDSIEFKRQILDSPMLEVIDSLQTI